MLETIHEEGFSKIKIIQFIALNAEIIYQNFIKIMIESVPQLSSKETLFSLFFFLSFFLFRHHLSFSVLLFLYACPSFHALL